MNIMFEETIFPPREKPINKLRSYAGGFKFWFEKIDSSNNLMVKCPRCNSIFCLEKNVFSEHTLKLAIQSQEYYFLHLIRTKCNGCRDMMYA